MNTLLFINVYMRKLFTTLFALAALAVAQELGLTPEEIKQGLAKVQPLFGRSQVLKGDVTFIQDCYNANPDSMESALDFFSDLELASGRKVLVIGDMLELGTQSCAMHQRVGAKVASLGIDLLVTLGARGRQIAVGAQRMGMKAVYSLDAPNGDNRRQIARRLRELLGEGDVVLFKASRGIGAEQIINELKV